MDHLRLERMAYLYLVSERDRRILLEQEQMKFSDFRKHVYLTEVFGFKSYNSYIWNQFSGQFTEKFEAMIGLLYEAQEPYPDLGLEEREQDDWIEEFCKNAPESEQEWLQKRLEEKGLEKWDEM